MPPPLTVAPRRPFLSIYRAQKSLGNSADSQRRREWWVYGAYRKLVARKPATSCPTVSCLPRIACNFVHDAWCSFRTRYNRRMLGASRTFRKMTASSTTVSLDLLEDLLLLVHDRLESITLTSKGSLGIRKHGQNGRGGAR
jgi:hypothetical protein